MGFSLLIRNSTDSMKCRDASDVYSCEYGQIKSIYREKTFFSQFCSCEHWKLHYAFAKVKQIGIQLIPDFPHAPLGHLSIVNGLRVKKIPNTPSHAFASSISNYHDRPHILAKVMVRPSRTTHPTNALYCLGGSRWIGANTEQHRRIHYDE